MATKLRETKKKNACQTYVLRTTAVAWYPGSLSSRIITCFAKDLQGAFLSCTRSAAVVRLIRVYQVSGKKYMPGINPLSHTSQMLCDKHVEPYARTTTWSAKDNTLNYYLYKSMYHSIDATTAAVYMSPPSCLAYHNNKKKTHNITRTYERM